jgi:ribosomal-protein-alanine N-acetyltransferase
LETARLRLVPLRREDTQAIHDVWTSPGVRRYLWDDEVIPEERTAGIVARSEELFRSEGFGLWGAWFRGRRELAGFGGLWHFRDPPELELLYGVPEEHWGQGLATEIGGTVIADVFSRLDFSSIVASTDVGNSASVRVAEKLGIVPVRQAVAAGRETAFFRLERPDVNV